MQSDDMREQFIVTGMQLVADVLTNVLTRNWEMGESSSPERTSSRRLHLSKPGMKSEERRLRTFQHWPDSAPVSPANLAAAGFFFIGPDDRVQCFCCGGVLYDWFAEDDPIVEHTKFFPACPFIQGWHARNQQMPCAGEIQDCVDGQFLGMLQSLGMEEAIADAQPEYSEVETEDGRLTTFVNWPAYAQVSPESLASAGFFYTGQDDYVQCFCCDGALRNWEFGEDPWVEHARWFPSCQFLLRSRGRDFVNGIQDPCLNSSESNIYRPENLPINPQASVGTLDLGSPHLTSMMHSALQMGFSPNSVTRLVQSKFQQTGARYRSMSELVLDLLQAVQNQGSQAEDTGEPSHRRADPCRLRRELEHQNEPASAPNMEEQLRRLREERMCKVCMDRDVSILLVPCGHLVVCAECAPNLRRCPICRGVIRDSMKAFLS